MLADNRTFEQAVEAIYGINVGVLGKGEDRHERPHKPVLLLAVMDLIAEGLASPDHIPWGANLRDRFSLYFQRVRRLNDQDTPENPFFYLRQETWWEPIRDGVNGPLPLEAPPLIRDGSNGQVFARLTLPVIPWVTSSFNRLRLRDAIIARFFPHARAELSPLFRESTVAEIPPPITEAACDDDKPGRSAGFRRVILEIYDYQCAACGLRIRVRELNDLTFVDAAHLIPFRDRELGGNDHPSNGMALCKLHHWAMDHRIIAPSPEGEWRVSRFLEARRSPGEAELLSLAGKPILLPHDEAFLPTKEALKWRFERLAA